ncbi:MAG: hypothetical protein JO154_01110 [Chitinophaga sp.]|uniref:hypothetical protein n=1 Tax=Chitinophaga sp. TaxID=1869181 RepID=UPI0025BFB9F3|nr:hypothetical protein [Chitinophaga sp.]MBV8251175.1 hypothetical protein [Chitinophaga sp.]
MDYKSISALLEKYWEGESTLAEEAALKAFFSESHPDMPEDLLEAAPLFQYLDAESDIPVLAEPEWDMSFLQEAPKKPAPVVKMHLVKNWMKYAAIILMAAGVGYGLKQHHENRQVAMERFKEEEEARKAYMETKRALALLSRNLNKGTDKMQQLSYFNTATEKLSVKD